MKEDEFVLENVSDKKASALSTSLDHEAYPNKQFSVQQNKYSSIHTAMVMLSRAHLVFFENASLIEALELDKNKKYFRIVFANFILKIYLTLCPSNPYLYEPAKHNCEDNVEVWKDIRNRVMSKHVDVKDIWNVMKQECEEIQKISPNL